MAGAMRKMAVYLGLVEDDGYDGRGFDPDDDFEPELDPEPERDHRRREPSHQSHGTHQPQRDEEVRVVHPPAPREPVSRSASLPAESPRPARIAPVASITQERASLEKNAPVIMNLTEMDDTDAKRLVDFAAGLVFGLHGSIERVTQKVFLLSPANVDVTAEDKARIAEGGFFNQS